MAAEGRVLFTRVAIDELVGVFDCAADRRNFRQWFEIGITQLDIACGSGGPSLSLVHQTGCRLTGVDIEVMGIERPGRQR
jgi:2-polyprenyl-3-methyl-5-hydroxy-6-metoxy-1,4-benzoquinol methylase